MSFFNRLFQTILPNTDSANKQIKEVLVREDIKHNRIFLEKYQSWIDREMHKGILTHLKDCYQRKITDSSATVNFQTLALKNAKGFYVRSENPWDTEDYSCLTHYFIQRLKQLNYRLNNATREAIEEDGSLKTEELFYLKPGLKYRKEIPYDQLFGNIIIEHKLVNGETGLLKLVANTYTDRNFKRAYDYEDLITELFLF